jgi:monoamine oxidase
MVQCKAGSVGHLPQPVKTVAIAHALLEGDLPSINLETADPAMYHVYQTADEVPGERAMLMGSSKPDVTAEEAQAAFGKFYPRKKSPTVEQAYVHNWAKDPWAFAYERHALPLGQLAKFWPHAITPVGWIHFAGAHADNAPGAWTPSRTPPTGWPKPSIEPQRKCLSARR